MTLITPRPVAGSRSSIPEAPSEHELLATLSPITAGKNEVTDRIDLGLFDGAIVEIDFTLGSLTDVIITPEFADREVDADYSSPTVRNINGAGVITHAIQTFKLTVTGKYHIPVKKAGRFMRLFTTPTGTNTGSSIQVTVVGAANIGEIADIVDDGSAISHGSLLNLLVDDHTQYALLAGRAGGQTLLGGNASGDDITIRSNSSDDGSIILGAGITKLEIDQSLGQILATGIVRLSDSGPDTKVLAVDQTGGDLGALFSSGKLVLGGSALTSSEHLRVIGTSIFDNGVSIAVGGATLKSLEISGSTDWFFKPIGAMGNATAASDTQIRVQFNATSTTTDAIGGDFRGQGDPGAGGNSGRMRGILAGAISVTGAGTASGTHTGSIIFARNDAPGILTTAIGATIFAQLNSAGSITIAVGGEFRINSSNAGGTIDTGRAVHVLAPGVVGALTRYDALRIEDPIGPTTANAIVIVEGVDEMTFNVPTLTSNQALTFGDASGEVALIDSVASGYFILAGVAGGQTLVGGTAAGDALRFRATASTTDGAIIFQSDPTTEVARFLADGKFGIGTEIPQATLEVNGPTGVSVGGFAAGQLHVTSNGAGVNDNAVITGHNLNGGNKQLWYLGSVSSSNDNIGFFNRQNGSMGFFTNNAQRILIDAAGLVGIGTSVPTSRLHVVGDTKITGNLIVEGTTSTIDSETLLVTDNHIYLNNGYTADPAQAGGIVVNFDPTTTADTVAAAGFTAGVAAVSNPTVITAGSATFAASDIIQISASTGNDGVYEVLSHVGTTLTIRGIGTVGTVEDFSQNQFTTEAGVGAITKIAVSVMHTGTDGVWETASGSVTGLTFDAVVGLAATQTLINKTLTAPTIGDFSNSAHSHQNAAGAGTLDAAAIASGTLPVSRGGTGVGTFADAGVLIGNGAGVVQVTTAGSAGEVLTSNGAGADPTFQAGATVEDFRQFRSVSESSKSGSVVLGHFVLTMGVSSDITLSCHVPEGWDTSADVGITVIGFTTGTDTSGVYDFALGVEITADGETVDGTDDVVLDFDENAPDGADVVLHTTEQLIPAANIAIGDHLNIEFRRENTTDTRAGDFRFQHVLIRWPMLTLEHTT